MTILFGIGLFTAALAYAEKCRNRDRVELPSCAKEIRTDSKVKVVNECSFPITVKWDIAIFPDYRRDIAPGEEREFGSFLMKINSVSCCSRYNQCSEDKKVPKSRIGNRFPPYAPGPKTSPPTHWTLPLRRWEGRALPMSRRALWTLRASTSMRTHSTRSYAGWVSCCFPIRSN